MPTPKTSEWLSGYAAPQIFQLADLKIPRGQAADEYQRDQTPRAEREFKAGGTWDRDMASSILVSTSTMNVMDGGFRVEFARQHGLRELPGLAYPGLSLRDEARIFDHFNTDRAAVTGKPKHKARLVYGERDAVAAQRLVDLVNHPVHLRLGAYVAAAKKPDYAAAVETLAPVFQELFLSTEEIPQDTFKALVHLQAVRGDMVIGVGHDRLMAAWDREQCDAGYREAVSRYVNGKIGESKRRFFALPATWSAKAECMLFALNHEYVESDDPEADGKWVRVRGPALALDKARPTRKMKSIPVEVATDNNLSV